MRFPRIDDLPERLRAQVLQKAPELLTPDRPVRATQKPGEPNSTAERKIASAAESPGYVELLGGLLALRFPRAMLPTVNDLLGVTLRTRIRLRNAWHDTVERAIAGGPDGLFAPIEPVYLIVTRGTPYRLCDLDNLNAKYAIDGLRYSGLLPDDQPSYVLGVFNQQHKGAPQVSILVLPRSAASAFVALRDLERQGMTFSGGAAHYHSALQRWGVKPTRRWRPALLSTEAVDNFWDNRADAHRMGRSALTFYGRWSQIGHAHPGVQPRVPPPVAFDRCSVKLEP